MSAGRNLFALCLTSILLLSACGAPQESTSVDGEPQAVVAESAVEEAAETQDVEAEAPSDSTTEPTAEPTAEPTTVAAPEPTATPESLPPTSTPSQEAPTPEPAVDWTRSANEVDGIYELGNPTAPIRLVDYSDFL